MSQQLRLYQRRIVDSIGLSNAIVKMPTGSGKMIVAAQLMANHFTGSAVGQSLCLVPTQDLVEQQAIVLERWCPNVKVLRFTGGMKDPQSSSQQQSCLVSTPKAFRHLQQRHSTFAWTEFGLVVFDEVHHVLKDHPYRHIALRSKAFIEQDVSSRTMQVIGMSASLTYAINETSITKTLGQSAGS